MFYMLGYGTCPNKKIKKKRSTRFHSLFNYMTLKCVEFIFLCVY